MHPRSAERVGRGSDRLRVDNISTVHPLKKVMSCELRVMSNKLKKSYESEFRVMSQKIERSSESEFRAMSQKKQKDRHGRIASLLQNHLPVIRCFYS
jgi:hypothetical protein